MAKPKHPRSYFYSDHTWALLAYRNNLLDKFYARQPGASAADAVYQGRPKGDSNSRGAVSPLGGTAVGSGTGKDNRWR